MSGVMSPTDPAKGLSAQLEAAVLNVDSFLC